MSELAAGDMPSELSNAQAEVAIGVSNLYGFLAGLYRSELSQEHLETLRGSEMQTALHAVGIRLQGDFWNESADLVASELAVEYTALFLGPGGHISPHESVQIEDHGAYWGDATLAVRRFITESGIEYSAEYNGIPDHISVELEFLAELARRESEAWLKQDTDAVINCLEYQRDFLGEHLGQWVGKFCSQVVERAELSFYREVANLTAMFVESEIEAVEERIADVRSRLGIVSMEPEPAVAKTQVL